MSQKESFLRVDPAHRIQDDKKAWAYVQGIDFEPIAVKIRGANPHWSEEHVQKAIESYRMYFYASRFFPELGSAPHPSIDEVWHAHILFTLWYARDCAYIVGYYLHHTPKEAMPQDTPEENAETMKRSYENMRKKMVYMFGEQYDPVLFFQDYQDEFLKKKNLS